MYPVLAQEEIQILDMNRRQRLAEAERDRQIKAAGTASGVPSPSTALLRRVRHALSDAFGALVRVRGAQGVPMRDESAAIPSA